MANIVPREQLVDATRELSSRKTALSTSATRVESIDAPNPNPAALKSDKPLMSYHPETPGLLLRPPRLGSTNVLNPPPATSRHRSANVPTPILATLKLNMLLASCCPEALDLRLQPLRLESADILEPNPASSKHDQRSDLDSQPLRQSLIATSNLTTTTTSPTISHWLGWRITAGHPWSENSWHQPVNRSR
jgi:hypothetical protein